MNYNLFLDDARKPEHVTWVQIPENITWTHAVSYDDFVKTIVLRGIPSFVSYDCDLCEEHYWAYFNLQERYVTDYKSFKTKCGIECVEFLIEYCKKYSVKHPPYKVHTRNNFAEAFITNMIEEFNAGKIKQYKPSINTSDATLPPYTVHNDATIGGFFGQYRFLSNFWPADVSWGGVTYPSVEVAYQAAKCTDRKEQAQFTTLHAEEAKKVGKRVSIRSNWEDIKKQIMTFLIWQKFHLHPELGELLIQTGDKYLAEYNAWRDKFWGVAFRFYGGEKKEWTREGGENNLGLILMETRKILR